MEGNHLLKPAISIDKQIELLIQRGMEIDDIEQAIEFLKFNNYYRLNVYFHQKMEPENQFIRGTSFEQIVSFYNNDQFLRNKLLMVVEPIEIKLRSSLAYHLGMNYGSDCIYHPDVCVNIQDHISFLAHIYETINSRQKDPVIKHHLTYYNGHFPIWVIVEYLSMNEASKYFSSLRTSDKKAIAQQGFALDENLLKSWLEALGVLRNICAHYGYLHERKFTKKPEMSKSMKALGVPNDTLFSLCLVIKELTDSFQWQEFVDSLGEKVKATPALLLSEYGFPHHGLNYLCS